MEAIYILQHLRHWWKTICATIYYSWDTNWISPEAQFYIWPHLPQQTQTAHVLYKTSKSIQNTQQLDILKLHDFGWQIFAKLMELLRDTAFPDET